MNKRKVLSLVSSAIVLGIVSALTLFISSQYDAIRHSLVFPAAFLFLLAGMIVFIQLAMRTMQEFFGVPVEERLPDAYLGRTLFEIHSISNVIIIGETAQLIRDSVVLIKDRTVEHFIAVDDIREVFTVRAGKKTPMAVIVFIQNLRARANG